MSNKKILVTGACGFLGRTLMPYLQEQGYEVVGLDAVPKTADILACDVSDEARLSALLQRVKPEVIVHCAARKNLPDCEAHKLETFASNALSTETIAAYARSVDAKVVYISSDVVFNGERGNYQPTDIAVPINWYGKTKMFSEITLRSVNNVAICRTALIIGKLNDEYKKLLHAELANDVLVNQTLLPQYIYQRLQNGQQVKLPATIISNPTPVELLCTIIGEVIAQDVRGVFHATGPSTLSRYDTGLLIAGLFKLASTLIVRDDAIISPLRPRNISMNSSATFQNLGIDSRKWELATYLADARLYD